ncbi:MAG: YceI family protein, partial [Parahaliea sp.]
QIAGVNTRSEERDMSLPGPEWFDSDQFPSATYIASRFRALPDSQQLVAEGRLTLKGIERPVALTFTWQDNGDHALLDGEATLDRRQFDIGNGMWAQDPTVGFEVEIQVKLRLRAPEG